MIVDNDGKPTHLYHAAKYLNPEFERIATELMSCKSLGAYHVGTIMPGTTALPENSAFKIQAEGLEAISPTPEKNKPAEGFVLGYFGKAGTNKPTHLVVVNLNYNKQVKATLTGPGKMEIFVPTSKSWYPTLSKTADLDLLPGGGVLVRLVDTD
jgi:hypothetical protein